VSGTAHGQPAYTKKITIIKELIERMEKEKGGEKNEVKI
jgi:hypothetical protein